MPTHSKLVMLMNDRSTCSTQLLTKFFQKYCVNILNIPHGIVSYAIARLKIILMKPKNWNYCMTIMHMLLANTIKVSPVYELFNTSYACWLTQQELWNTKTHFLPLDTMNTRGLVTWIWRDYSEETLSVTQCRSPMISRRNRNNKG